VAADALTMKVREHGRVVNAVVLVATGVNGDGHREVLGVKVATSETKEAWNVFSRVSRSRCRWPLREFTRSGEATPYSAPHTASASAESSALITVDSR
jgi:hypothetical protein